MSTGSTVTGSSIRKEPIAIVGIGCRFPGSADTPERFWDLVKDGGIALTDVPADRWNADRFYSPETSAPGKMYVRTGGFLKENIFAFDPLFFEISPKQAQFMDPQQRLLLEVTYQALEDAGITANAWRGSDASVYVGSFNMDAMALQLSPLNRSLIRTHHVATASSVAMLANRISYYFDLRGPSVTLDTACSSSLVAVHHACESLWRAESSLALAGGVSLMICPQVPMVMCKGHFLSQDGSCKTFDSRADGYARGEGCGMVVLKRLADALRDQDQIYALIRGTGVNQDGRTEGITVPNGLSQEALIRDVFRRAGVGFDKVQYVEAHGTGTPVGDPIEAGVIGRTIGASRNGGPGCPVGSVKGNIGHLEAAAGVAGLIKASLCLHYGAIPPQGGFQSPSPDIPFSELGIRVPEKHEPLLQPGQTSCAAVNSFGFGGTNAHVLLETVPVVKPAPSPPGQTACLLPLSARTESALQALALSYAGWLRQNPSISLADVCFSSGARRTHFDHRLAVTADSPLDAARELQTWAETKTASRVVSGRTSPTAPVRPVFVFSGMGPQWWGMGRELLKEEPVFRNAAEECDRLFAALAGWSPLTEMNASEQDSRMNETQIAQPANFVLQVGLAALWESWGISPSAVVGHSVGEVAAAYVAGALSLQDAVCVIHARSNNLPSIEGAGRMLAANVDCDAVAPFLEGRESAVCIAAVNSPFSLTLSGDAGELSKIAQELDRQRIFNRFLNVQVPYHSPAADVLIGPIERAVSGVKAHLARVPIYSTVTGSLAGPGEFGPDYWPKNVRLPVLFESAIRHAIDDGHRLFLELGPHPVLGDSVAQCAESAGIATVQLSSLRRGPGERTALLKSASALYVAGLEPQWAALFPDARYVRLPHYPWQRQNYWIETEAALADRLTDAEHPLTGYRLPVASPTWEFDPWRGDVRYLNDHVVDGSPVMPAAAYVEAGLAIHRMMDGDTSAVLEDIAFLRLFPLEDGEHTLHWTYNGQTREYEAVSKTQSSEFWTVHAKGRISPDRPAEGVVFVPGEVRGRCKEQVNVASFYGQLKERGLEYKNGFRGIRQLWRTEGEALAEIHSETQPESTLLHPCVLDSAIQSLVAALETKSGAAQTKMFLPAHIREFRFYGPRGRPIVWAHTRVRYADQETIEADIDIAGEDGALIASVKALRCAAVQSMEADVQDPNEQRLYKLVWEKTQPVAEFAEPGHWLVLADNSGAGERLAAWLSTQTGSEAIRAYQSAGGYRREDFEALLTGKECHGLTGIVFLWALDHSVEGADVAGIDLCASALALLQALSHIEARNGATPPPRVYFVTDKRLAHASLRGFIRTAVCELPELRCTSIEAGGLADNRSIRRLGAELLSASEEDEVSLQGPDRYVRRLARASITEIRNASESERAVPADSSTPLGLEVKAPGRLDSLCFRAAKRKPPGFGEVEVHIEAAALNFKDVLKASALLPAAALEGTFHGTGIGMEAAGTVVAVGSGVERFKPGDRIVASLPGSFRSHVTVHEHSLFGFRCPENSALLEAVTIPVAFLTAWYALHEIARLIRGESVLIHAAAGGVGLAAIQVAKWLGAEIFATAGSVEKRKLLLDLGARQVWNSRDLTFADGIREATNGQGVDVVLNSLPGEAFLKSLSLVAPFGRFVEIGKRDIVENHRMPMLPFNRNLSFTAIDLDRMMMDRPALIRRLLDEVQERFDAGDFTPLPATVYTAANISDAFRCMQQSKHIGKVVVDFADLTGVKVLPSDRADKTLREDGTWLITGGLGGVGIELARWLAGKGARHIVLLSRRASPPSEAIDGATIRVINADVACEADVLSAMTVIDADMPPLRGIFHLAAVTDDDWIQNLDRSRIEAVLRAKAQGAWNLHTCSIGRNLDHFVLFSSAVGWLGNPGQAAYSAANCFLDNLAEYRQSLELPGLSIAWGAIGGAGMLEGRSAVKDHLAKSGIQPIAIAEILEGLDAAMQWNLPQAGIMDIDWKAWTSSSPASRSPRFRYVVNEQNGRQATPGGLTGLLLSLNPAERVNRIATAVAEALAKIIVLPVEKIDVHQPLTQLGIDSLVGMELRSTLQATLGIELTVLDLIKGNTLTGIAHRVVDRMSAAAVSPV